VQDNRIVFRHGPTTISIQLIDGTFPDVDQVLPKETDKKARIKKADLMAALKFAGTFAPETHRIRISFFAEECEISAQDTEKGEVHERVPVEYSGSSLEIDYNYRYLLDVFNVIDGDEIVMEPGHQAPTLIRDVTSDEMLFVVMPMVS
jgi:DNA polymerase-3 subunit beta